MSDERPVARPGDSASDERPAARPGDSAPERAGFGEVLAVREFRALFLSSVVSWVGDYLARAAIIVLVYQQSQSVSLSAASFAISYLPWILGGPLLSALAERYPYRRVLIATDLSRAVPIALIALPGVPIPVILVLLFVAMLGAPPTQATRSALIPLVLERRLLVTGLALNSSTIQGAQVFGYLAGATLAAGVNPRLGLALDALSFLLSAAIVAAGIRPRASTADPARRRHLLRETGEGFQIVFGTPALRSIAVMVFALASFVVLPEGLAASWAAVFHDGRETDGFDQGLIMAAGPIGFVAGGIVAGTLGSQAFKQRLTRPLALFTPICLALTAFAPNAVTVAVLVALSGVGQGVLVPTLNSAFVLALPHGMRARAFGVIAGGLQLTQGIAVLATGVLAEHSSIPLVVGLWSLGGVVLMAVVSARRTGDAPAQEPPAPAEAGATAGPVAPREPMRDPLVPRATPGVRDDLRSDQAPDPGAGTARGGPAATHITPGPVRRHGAGRLDR